jgi:hypothetical protein
VIVPVAIQTSFDTKYPKATKVVWYQYVPDKTMPQIPLLGITAWMIKITT